jgi:predicted metal-dependent hydrolase
MKEIILIFLIFIFIYIFVNLNKNITYIEPLTKINYLVYNDENKEEKIQLLTNLIKNMYTLKEYLKDNISKFPDKKDYIIQLTNNFNENKTIIYESDPKSNYTSYSVNKGQEISFCLRSKINKKELHDLNLIMYVALHEMAHIACPEIGHTDLFKEIFNFFTIEAINIGLYKKIDFTNNPVNYCGLILNSSIV